MRDPLPRAQQADQAAQAALREARQKLHVGMPCPRCQGRSLVLNTRHEGRDIRRWRRCRECGRRWQTVEQDAA